MNLKKIFHYLRNPRLAYQALHYRSIGTLQRKAEAKRVAKEIEILNSIPPEKYDEIRVERLSSLLQVSKQAVMDTVSEINSDTAFMDFFESMLAFLGQQMQSVSSLIDCKTIYCVARIVKPLVVVETGVDYGGSSAFLLRALDRNGQGRLFSIDKPDPGLAGVDSEKGQGCLIPPWLKHNWNLTNGDSKVELPRLLSQLGSIDMFFHDSLHTYSFMSWEYSTAWHYISKGGILSTHDVLLTNAFRDFCRKNHVVDRSVVICDVGITRK